MRELTTYPFSEPNPIPILTQDKRLYPYHKFVGYSHDGIPKKWKVIKMENEHIKVYVLPEVGGKVWGAIDKSNGEEFIYRNGVKISIEFWKVINLEEKKRFLYQTKSSIRSGMCYLGRGGNVVEMGCWESQ